jgi:hypothetical protein
MKRAGSTREPIRFLPLGIDEEAERVIYRRDALETTDEE